VVQVSALDGVLSCRLRSPRPRRKANDPRNTIVSVKRFMGRGLADIAHRESMPYHFDDAPGMLRLHTAAGIKSPVEVSADILRTLRPAGRGLHLGGALSSGR
jgi:molecular chaperone HscA